MLCVLVKVLRPSDKGYCPGAIKVKIDNESQIVSIYEFDKGIIICCQPKIYDLP